MISRRQSVQRLRDLALDRKEALPTRELSAIDSKLYKALLHHFGSIVDARAYAGVQAPQPRRKWSTERIIKDLQRLHKKGVRITVTDLQKSGNGPLAKAACAYFDGMFNARDAAGIPHPPRKMSKRRTWDKQDVIDEIQKLHDRGESLAYANAPSKLKCAARNYHGSREEAIEAAGYCYEDIRT